MNLGELINLARIRLDDLNQPYLWSDAALTEFANTAQAEAADRARLVRVTEAITVNPTTDTTPGTYSLSEPPLFIYDVRYTYIDTDGNSVVAPPISPYSHNEFSLLTMYGPATGDPPRFYKNDDIVTNITLYPTPTLPATMTVNYSRLPTEDELMVSSGDEPVIPTRYHRDLVWWMLFEAYTLRDADSNDVKRAADAEQKFEQKFGRKPSAKHNTHIRATLQGKDVYPVRFGGTL